MDFEQEYTPTEPQVDTIWVRDGRGTMILLEVEDDVEYD